MKRKKFTEEQIIGILRQADAGKRPDELARENGMSVGSFYAWKAKFGGMSIGEAQRVRALEDENRRLKALVADQALDNAMLRSVVEKKLGVSERRDEVERLLPKPLASANAELVESLASLAAHNATSSPRLLMRRCKRQSSLTRMPIRASGTGAFGTPCGPNSLALACVGPIASIGLQASP